MRRPKAAFAVLGTTAILALLILVWFCSTGRPRIAFDLPDGSSMELLAVKQGTNFHFYEGKLWQKALFTLCHKNISARYGGWKIEFVPAETNGALVLQFEQRFGRRGLLRGGIGTKQMLLKWMTPSQKVERKFARQDLHWAIVAGRCRTYDRTLYWEFPVPKEQQLHFCLFYSDASLQISSTNLFTIKNPAFE